MYSVKFFHGRTESIWFFQIKVNNFLVVWYCIQFGEVKNTGNKNKIPV